MSKKTAAASQKSAAKRNARSKAKAVSAAKGKNAPMGVARKKMRGLNINGGGNNFNAVLDQAVRQINKGGNVGSGPQFNSTSEVIAGIVKAAGETFKMFCYAAVAKELADEGAIEHNFRADISTIGEGMMLVDNRVTRLRYFLESPEFDEGAFGTEALEIGTIIHGMADELYEEVARMDEHSLVIEETISRLASELPEGEEAERRAKVLSACAYKLLAAIKLQMTPAQIKAENETPAEEAPVAEESVPGGESVV